VSGAALAFMVLVAGFVWGGFAVLLARALRCEAGKGGSSEGRPGGS
jgi:hypothetical protein